MGVIRQMPQHTAHLPRTGFDMSQRFAFTSSCGMILPVYQDILNVGETVYLNGELFSRTQPLVTSAMADVDVYLDWFFVPIPMLFQLFPSIRYQTNDYFSSVFQSEITQFGTYLPLSDISAQAKECQSFLYSAPPSSVFSNAGYGSEFDCIGKQTFRLLNHLGFNPYAIFNGDTNADVKYRTQINPTVFPLFPLAYQAIYQDYFRIEDYEKRDPRCCNFDWAYNQQSVPDNDYALQDGLLALRYRPRHKDYFTSVKVSPISSSINLLSGDNSNPSAILQKVDSFLDTRAFTVGSPDGVASALPSGVNYGSYSVTQVVNNSSGNNNYLYTRVSTNQIRNMFAVEKLLRIIGRSKKDYDSQVLAHFGYKVPHDVKHQLTHLFEQHALLHIGEVVSNTDNYDVNTGMGSALGSISGKGYVNIPKNKQSYKFTAPVDGVIMCTYSCVPRFRYYKTFDKQNSITTRLDFYTPEFDKLGMQPLYVYEANCSVLGTSDRLGWQYRYQQHKQKYDRCTEAFMTDQNNVNHYSAWLLGHDSFLKFSAGVSGYYPPTMDSFYCAPTDLNSIMVVDYSPLWSASYLTYPYQMFDTDPFINDFHASVKKVSTMSTTGEPDL